MSENTIYKNVKEAILNIQKGLCPVCGEKYSRSMSGMTVWCENPKCRYFIKTHGEYTRSTYLFPAEMKYLLECIYEKSVEESD